jgi:hypothetical protein
MPWIALAGDPLRGGLDDPTECAISPLPQALSIGPHRFRSRRRRVRPWRREVDHFRLGRATADPLHRHGLSVLWELRTGRVLLLAPVLRLRYEHRLDGCFRSVQVRPGWRILANGQPSSRSSGALPQRPAHGARSLRKERWVSECLRPHLDRQGGTATGERTTGTVGLAEEDHDVIWVRSCRL